MSELLPRFDAEEYLETPELKGGNDLKEALRVMSFYSSKHIERAERGLKKAYYPEYVLSQMTIDEELKSFETPTSYQEVKSKAIPTAPKSAKQI